MGSPVAPSLANIFMAAVEESKILNSKYARYNKIRVHLVYDVFMVWTGTEHELSSFLHDINYFHKLSKFTLTKDPKEIFFLDVKIMRQNNKRHTALF